MRYSFIIFIFGFCVGCGSSTAEQKNEIVEEEVKAPITLDVGQLSVYQLTAHPVTDSLLLPLKVFNEYNEKINDLAKLDPNGVEPFILTALIKCDVLLKKKLPTPFETPEIKSRLKVVKTQLLKARYFSQQEQIEELSTSFRQVFVAHEAYLKRIEDFALDATQTSITDLKDLD